MIEFLREATVGNVHAFWHIFGGALSYAIFRGVGYSNKKRLAIIITFIFAVLFEIIMAYSEGIDGYSGGLMGYIADTFGDIFFAVLAAWILSRVDN